MWETKPGITITKLSPERISELAVEAGITITELRPQSEISNWFGARILDPVAWRTRAYFGLKMPLAAVGLAVVAGCWLGGLFCATFPAWHAIGLANSFDLLPVGGILLVAAPSATHGVTEADRRLGHACSRTE